jgi:hypothetical protein
MGLGFQLAAAQPRRHQRVGGGWMQRRPGRARAVFAARAVLLGVGLALLCARTAVVRVLGREKRALVNDVSLSDTFATHARRSLLSVAPCDPANCGARSCQLANNATWANVSCTFPFE